MEISGPSNIPGPRKISGKKVDRPGGAEFTPGAGKPDSAEFSQIAQFLDGLSKVDPMRHEKIQAIKQQIERGEYETTEKLEVALKRLIEDIA